MPNHTSFDSEWVLECPNAAFNTKNTPSLTSAYVFDQTIQDLSRRIMNGEVPEFPEPYIRTEEDVNKVMSMLTNQLIPAKKIHEYFLADVGKLMVEFRAYVKEHAPNAVIPEQQIDDEEDLYNVFTADIFAEVLPTLEKNIQNLGATPFGVTFDMKELCDFFVKNSPKISYESLQMALKRLNQKNDEMARNYINEGLNAVRGTMMYEKVTSGNHKLTEVYPLVPPYFTVLKDGTACANNGWMHEQSINEVFADCNHFHYLRRHLYIWGDLVKLRYGKSKETCPYLWKRIKRHAQELATAFDGFRIDNSHSTPIHVCEYLIRKARKANPNIYVFAELFTPSIELDALYTKRVGFNALVREALRVNLFYNNMG